MASDWEEVNLGDLFEQSNQGVNTTTEKVEYSDDGLIVIRAKNISAYSIDYQDVVHVSEETFDKLKSAVKPKCGDILFTNIGSQLGSAALVKNNSNFIIAWNVFRIVPNLCKVNAKFLESFLNSEETGNLVRGLNASSTMPFISGKVLRGIKLNLPPLSEQKAIAHILGSLDDKIELNRQMNETLEAMTQALFKSWFVDFDPVIDNALAAGNAIPDALQKKASERAEQRKNIEKKDNSDIQHLFPDAFEFTEEMGWVPKGWEVKSLDETANYLNGLALQKYRPGNIDDDYLPVVKIAQLREGVPNHDEKASINIKPEYIIDNGDVIFSWSGSLLVDIWCGGKAALNQHLFKVTSDKYPKWFYLNYTKHHLIEFQRIATDKAVTMGHIKRGHLKEALCVIPRNGVNDNVFAVFEDILNKQISSRIESQTLAKLRDNLLPKLMSGELRIPDATALVENV